MRLIVMLLALLAMSGCDRQKPPTQQGKAPAADVSPSTDTAGQIKGVHREFAGQPAPATVFKNPDGGDFNLTKFQGGPVIVNLWASWCAPCIKELPTLQKLEETQILEGRLGVIAVSQDNAPQSSVEAFLAAKNISRFAAFHDKDMALSSALGVQVMPTTILYDAKGKEAWRYVGDLDWTSAEAKALIAEVSPEAVR